MNLTRAFRALWDGYVRVARAVWDAFVHPDTHNLMTPTECRLSSATGDKVLHAEGTPDQMRIFIRRIPEISAAGDLPIVEVKIGGQWVRHPLGA